MKPLLMFLLGALAGAFACFHWPPRKQASEQPDTPPEVIRDDLPDVSGPDLTPSVPASPLLGQRVTYHDRETMRSTAGVISDIYDAQPHLAIVRLESGQQRFGVPVVEDDKSVTGHRHYCVPVRWN